MKFLKPRDKNKTLTSIKPTTPYIPTSWTTPPSRRKVTTSTHSQHNQSQPKLLPRNALSILNPKNKLNRIRPAIPQPLQRPLHAPQPTGDNNLRLSPKPTDLQPVRQIPKIHKPKAPLLFLTLMHAPDVRQRMLHMVRDAAIILSGEDKRELGPLSQDFRQIFIAAVLRDRVESVQKWFSYFFARGLERSDKRLVADAVVEDRVPLATVDERFDVRAGAPRDADQGVDVALARELDRVGADGRGCAVDD